MSYLNRFRTYPYHLILTSFSTTEFIFPLDH
ncbi:hypothetical protein F383_08421 [Gossypium arboreum]|uniref:Uncharacterized protein n=1 Tax=Gossypium arboreum TaxID=29729 RepID=A0A0B0PIG3_GOSAR|nr:hypothetical protein F383_08421 [Gossypium arboreum]